MQNIWPKKHTKKKQQKHLWMFLKTPPPSGGKGGFFLIILTPRIPTVPAVIYSHPLHSCSSPIHGWHYSGWGIPKLLAASKWNTWPVGFTIPFEVGGRHLGDQAPVFLGVRMIWLVLFGTWPRGSQTFLASFCHWYPHGNLGRWPTAPII